jgi:putative ABC transport system substrate-binding protein
MNRRAFVTRLTAGALLASRAVEAQPAARMPRVGVIATTRGYEAFRLGLRELAYREGENVALEFRSTEAPNVRLADVARELVRLKVDVVLAASTPATEALRQATTTIPIVMLAADPVASGLVPSLSRPEGNVTGLSFNETGTGAKRLELLREALPSARRVAALDAAGAAANPIRKETEAAARTLGVELQSFAVRDPDDLEKTFAAMAANRAESLLVMPTTLAFVHRARIIALAIKNRLPTMFWRREFADAGGLMAYGPDQQEMYRRAAVYVSKILQGAKPMDLPVEQPRKFELVINLKTARALGLTIPRPVVLQADHVIE